MVGLLQCSHSISLNSATSGLFASVGALGFGFGDEIIVSPYTMTAAAAAFIIWCSPSVCGCGSEYRLP